MAGWRFYLMRLPSRTWIDKDLPLVGGQVTEAENASAAITGRLPLGLPGLTLANGEPVIEEWNCAIVAEQEGLDPVFAIVDKVSVSNDVMTLQAGGFSMYPKGMPWLGPEFVGIDVDPLDQVRRIWEHLQSYEAGRLNVTVDSTTSPVRIGTKEEDISFETKEGESVEFQAGPFRLASWNVDDLGGVLDQLAEETPFSFRERTKWQDGGLIHRLELGYPRLGVRRDTHRFEIGVNAVAPPPTAAGAYANEVWMQGAGEGRNKLKSSAHLVKPTNRIRRVHVATDKNAKSVLAAKRAGQPILDRLSGQHTIESLSVIDHSFAPFGTFDVGDEILVVGDAGWIQLNHWVRILEITDDCDTGVRSLGVRTV